MKRYNLVTFISTLVLTLSLGACSSGKKVAEPVVTPTPIPTQTQSIITTPAALQCSASLNKSVAAAEELLTLTVQASGGSGNYSIPGLVNSFAQSTALYGSYHNYTNATVNMSRTISVRDSAGAAATCGFSVAVTPYSGGPVPGNSLSCQINVAANPQPGVPTQFTIVGAGAPSGASYTFSQFSPDFGVYMATTPVSSNANSTTVSASYTYPVAKYTTASISVTAGGTTVPCALQLSVSSPDLLVSGSTAASVGSSIYLQLTASGFGYNQAKYFGYQTAEPNVQVSISENNIAGTANLVITATDNAPHAAFNLAVSVNTPNGNVVTKQVSLSFSQPLNCTLSQLDSPIRTNSATRFQMTASTGETLQITDLIATSDVQNVSGLNVNPISLQFPARGYYYFSVKAKSTSRNVFCNNGNYIGYTAEVNTALVSCSVAATVEPAVVLNSVTFSAVLPDNSGPGPFTISMTTNGSTIDMGPASGLDKTVAFLDSGYFHVMMSVRDNSTGTTVNCDRWQTVNQPSRGLQAKFYDIPVGSRQNHFLSNSGFEAWTPQAVFSVDDISVPNTRSKLGFPGLPYGLGVKKEYFAISYQGRIYADTEGWYDFETLSDDGVILAIEKDAGTGLISVISNDSIHAPTKNTGRIYLNRGYHKIKLNYFQGPPSRFAMQLKWRPPYHGSMGYNLVPASVLFAPAN